MRWSRLSTALFLTILPLSLVASAAPGDRSPDGLWLEVDRSALGEFDASLPTGFRIYQLDYDTLAGVLADAPDESAPRNRRNSATGVQITLPSPDGAFVSISVFGSPVLSSGLAAQFPSIRTFSFRGTDDRGLSGRCTVNGHTFQAIFRPPSDFSRVTPLATSTGIFYLSYLDHDRTDEADSDHGHDEPRTEPPTGPAAREDAMGAAGAGVVEDFEAGGTRREFRLAAATTGEYYQARDTGGGDADVVASIATEVSNANAVFEPELAVRLILSQLALFSDPDTDPYTAGATACQLRDENVAAINGVIDPDDYDIGFAFGSGGGNGCAWYVVCLADKARGAGLVQTGNPVGSATRLLVHEMGHQLGARHTFSSGTGSCGNPGEFNQPDAYEPGSGSTIMSYLGTCSPNNVDVSGVGAGLYYHTYSFDQTINNITNVVACGASLATGNHPPSVDAGADYTIPRSTPFVLAGSANDSDGDPLTYTWEQFDVAANQRDIDTDTGEGPIIRSVPPTPDPSRTIPALADILSGTHRKGEQLPYTDRTLTFRLTARDNRMGGGGVSYDAAVLTVAGDPFSVTSPNGAESLAAGCPAEVTWSVGGGSVAPSVDLDFSEDGGNVFTPLLAGTPNDGSAEVTVPCAQTTEGRVKASGAGNIFFDISDADFSVVPTPPAVSVAAAGGEVDENCEFTVNFSATVEDDCLVNAADVQAQVQKLTANFDLGPVVLNTVQDTAQHVSVSGSVVVSNVFDSPARLSIQVSGADACGAQASESVEVEVADTTPPSISLSLDPALLWPANHKLRNVTAQVTATDNCPNTTFVLTSVTSSEPDNGPGDGNTTQDIQGANLGTPDLSLLLRAERSGRGPGRTYTVTYTATDASDNETSASADVVVPHSRKK